MEVSKHTNLQKISYCLQIAKGLRLLHQKNVLHRDIKPENIFIKIENGEWIIKIGDLGSSREENPIQMTIYVGTFPYIDPLRIRNETYGKDCDMFALGITYLQIITGKYPFNFQSNITPSQFQALMD